MSWGNLNMDGAPTVRCYADALKAWEKSKPWVNTERTNYWRCMPDNERPLCNRRHRHKSVIKRGVVGAIAFHLHSTDVITYFPDGTVEIDPYNSQTTDQFAWKFVPDGIRTHLSCGAICVMQRGDSYGWKTGRYYQTSGTMRLKPADGEYLWEVTGAYPWERKHVDKAKMRVACEEAGYNLFRDTCHAYFGLQHHMGRAFLMPLRGRALEVLKAGPSEWGAFMMTPDPRPRRRAFDSDPPFVLSTILKKLRQDICLEAKAYTVEKLPYVVGSEAWRRMRFPEF